jgi:hypothetical protein
MIFSGFWIFWDLSRNESSGLAIFVAGCSRRSVSEGEATETSPAAVVAESVLTEEGMGQRLREVVGFGPRASGSEGAKQLREWMIRGLEESGWKVERQAFVSTTPQGEVEFVNVIARFGAGGDGGGANGVARNVVHALRHEKVFND